MSFSSEVCTALHRPAPPCTTLHRPAPPCTWLLFICNSDQQEPPGRGEARGELWPVPAPGGGGRLGCGLFIYFPAQPCEVPVVSQLCEGRELWAGRSAGAEASVSRAPAWLSGSHRTGGVRGEGHPAPDRQKALRLGSAWEANVVPGNQGRCRGYTCSQGGFFFHCSGSLGEAEIKTWTGEFGQVRAEPGKGLGGPRFCVT